MTFNTISVVGLGYIGLPTAAMLASKNIKIIGVDVNKTVVDTINSGNIHIVECGLNALVRRTVGEGYLRAVVAPEAADAFLIAVPTPFMSTSVVDKIPTPDLRYVESAARSVARVLKRGDLVILESTSPVGTTEKMARWLAEERPDLSFPQTHSENSDIRIAYCPERVLPGQVIKELVENDRVIGGMTEACSEAAVNLYKIFVTGDCIVTNSRTAEMTKLVENASRDVSIAFANELSIICDKINVDVWELIRLANRHPRVNILNPGPGVGGHCIAVDPWFIVSGNPDDAKLIHCARRVNDSKSLWVIDKIKAMATNFLLMNPTMGVHDLEISFFGLAFKSDIDDLRESPALAIVRAVAALFTGQVIAVEPNINVDSLPNETFSLVSIDRALASPIQVVLVAHHQFIRVAFDAEKTFFAVEI
ncbi:MAG: UDP-N-acetyl-D-mannosamine dehydrogenase [Porticoccaceae bacterium]|nr:UDP-N-acetyl-D-mannosamine dehydrogenase [Porticoccaceae bacterium]